MKIWIVLLLITSFHRVALATEPQALFSRIELKDYSIGSIEQRYGHNKNLSLPDFECSSGAEDCARFETFRQVFVFEFSQEQISEVEPGVRENAVVPRGRLGVAVSLSKIHEMELNASIDGFIQSLTSDGLDKNFGQLEAFSGPFNLTTIRNSLDPYWMCQEVEGNHQLMYARQREGSEMITLVGKGGAQATQACEPLFASVAEDPATKISLPPSFSRAQRYELWITDNSNVGDKTWGDPLASLPDELESSRDASPKSTQSSLKEGEGSAAAKHDKHGSDEVAKPEARLNLQGHPMWVLSWKERLTEQSPGLNPQTSTLQERRVTAAVVPIADPKLSQAEQALPLSFPREEITASVLSAAMEKKADLLSAVVDALSRERVWPDLGEWMTVVCLDESSAVYGIAPSGPITRATNGREICSQLVESLR